METRWDEDVSHPSGGRGFRGLRRVLPSEGAETPGADMSLMDLGLSFCTQNVLINQVELEWSRLTTFIVLCLGHKYRYDTRGH